LTLYKIYTKYPMGKRDFNECFYNHGGHGEHGVDEVKIIASAMGGARRMILLAIPNVCHRERRKARGDLLSRQIASRSLS
jgi:hypothetical protein